MASLASPAGACRTTYTHLLPVHTAPLLCLPATCQWVMHPGTLHTQSRTKEGERPSHPAQRVATTLTLFSLTGPPRSAAAGAKIIPAPSTSFSSSFSSSPSPSSALSLPLFALTFVSPGANLHPSLVTYPPNSRLCLPTLPLSCHLEPAIDRPVIATIVCSLFRFLTHSLLGSLLSLKTGRLLCCQNSYCSLIRTSTHTLFEYPAWWRVVADKFSPLLLHDEAHRQKLAAPSRLYGLMSFAVGRPAARYMDITFPFALSLSRTNPVRLLAHCSDSALRR
ncbi:hypothetical protein F5Y09DRAFT_311058 [Xylaria sp. FL1042]|nr:hypothetical protein F5Y09DRAFT_311058 [Xylaria sp. FL1042]